jgi:hypothetical protein
MIKILKTIQTIFFVIFSVNWWKVIRNYSSTSDNVVLIYPDIPRDFLKYFFADSFNNDMALINAFAALGVPFKIIIGKEKAYSCKNIHLFFNLGNRFRHKDSADYSAALLQFMSEMAARANTCYPSQYEAFWWENKAFMHQKFEELGIKTPYSKISNTANFHPEILDDFSFPMLIKEAHSAGSLGVHKIASKDAALQLVKSIHQRFPNSDIILQSLLSMDRDLRVIIIGEEVVLHYWRINQSKTWQPTSTKHGSLVDFDYFPEQWRKHILTEFKKMNLRTGAFDLVWENNDYNYPPFVLEISTSYQANPKPNAKLNGSYGQFKAGFQLFNSYPRLFVTTTFDLKLKLVKLFLVNNERSV